MSIELSPSQERRLHSILDRGLDTLQETVANISHNTPIKLDPSPVSNPSPKDSDSTGPTTKSRILNSELKYLQEKLATLEAKLSKPVLPRTVGSRARSPATFLHKVTAGSSPRQNPSISVTRSSKDRLRNKSSTKELKKLNRSITPSPARHRSSVKIKAKPSVGNGKMRRESARDEVEKFGDLKASHLKLVNDYEKLLAAFKKSERIRKKQSELIAKLKNELKEFN